MDRFVQDEVLLPARPRRERALRRQVRQPSAQVLLAIVARDHHTAGHRREVRQVHRLPRGRVRHRRDAGHRLPIKERPRVRACRRNLLLACPSPLRFGQRRVVDAPSRVPAGVQRQDQVRGVVRAVRVRDLPVADLRQTPEKRRSEFSATFQGLDTQLQTAERSQPRVKIGLHGLIVQLHRVQVRNSVVRGEAERPVEVLELVRDEDLVHEQPHRTPRRHLRAAAKNPRPPHGVAVRPPPLAETGGVRVHLPLRHPRLQLFVRQQVVGERLALVQLPARLEAHAPLRSVFALGARRRHNPPHRGVDRKLQRADRTGHVILEDEDRRHRAVVIFRQVVAVVPHHVHRGGQRRERAGALHTVRAILAQPLLADLRAVFDSEQRPVLVGHSAHHLLFVRRRLRPHAAALLLLIPLDHHHVQAVRVACAAARLHVADERVDGVEPNHQAARQHVQAFLHKRGGNQQVDLAVPERCENAVLLAEVHGVGAGIVEMMARAVADNGRGLNSALGQPLGPANHLGQPDGGLPPLHEHDAAKARPPALNIQDLKQSPNFRGQLVVLWCRPVRQLC